ncbi:MAG: ABC transporter ATP-binding protein [Pseudomonadota bacterium]
MRNRNQIIMPSAEKAPVHTGNVLAWMWYFLTPYKGTVIGYTIFRFIRASYLAFLPIVVGFVINSLEDGNAQANPDLFFIGLIAYMVGFGVFLFNLVLIPEVRVYEKSIRAMTIYCIQHLNKLSIEWHEKKASGGKLQRVMTARVGFQELARFYRWDLFPMAGQITTVIFSIFLLNIPGYYFIFYMLFIFSFLTSSYYFARPYLRLFDKYQETFEGLLAGVYEFVSSIRTVKSFILAPYIDRRAKSLEEEGQGAIIGAFSQNLRRWTICNMITLVWLTLFILYGFHLVLKGEMTAGAYATTFFLASNIWLICEYFGSFLEKMFEHGNAIHRMVKTLRVEPKVFDLEPVQDIPQEWQSIHFKNVSFSYDKEGKQGISDISFDVHKGQKIALVGNSGAGKSTLIKLILKQVLADQGSIEVNDTNIANIKSDQWLQNIGYVPQDIELFNLTIRDNILLDYQDIDDEILQSTLKEAALDEFIETLPNGLDTFVGERGVKLSGGQRQRLGIARALIRQTPIIIFDEATSALDSISESKIQRAIENSLEGRTAFIIAHRLSTIKSADRILVLDEGKIIEDGDFDSLIKLDKHFAKLWSIQSRYHAA